MLYQSKNGPREKWTGEAPLHPRLNCMHAHTHTHTHTICHSERLFFLCYSLPRGWDRSWIVHGYIYCRFSVNSCACANMCTQALLSPPLEPGNEATETSVTDTICNCCPAAIASAVWFEQEWWPYPLGYFAWIEGLFSYPFGYFMWIEGVFFN